MTVWYGVAAAQALPGRPVDGLVLDPRAARAARVACPAVRHQHGVGRQQRLQRRLQVRLAGRLQHRARDRPRRLAAPPRRARLAVQAPLPLAAVPEARLVGLHQSGQRPARLSRLRPAALGGLADRLAGHQRPPVGQPALAVVQPGQRVERPPAGLAGVAAQPVRVAAPDSPAGSAARAAPSLVDAQLDRGQGGRLVPLLLGDLLQPLALGHRQLLHSSQPALRTLRWSWAPSPYFENTYIICESK